MMTQMEENRLASEERMFKLIQGNAEVVPKFHVMPDLNANIEDFSGEKCDKSALDWKMFPLVEFAEESGGGLSVIRSEGYTPRKKEVFWLSTKESKKFEKILLSENQTFDKWKLYSIKRCLYESDDYKVIKKKLRRAEDTSDLQSEADEVVATLSKRKTRPTQRLLQFDSSEEDTASKFSRPPTISLDRQLRNVASQQQLEVLELVAQCSIPISRSSTPQSSLSGLDSSIVENSTLTTCLDHDIRQPEEYLKRQDNYDALRCHLSTFGGKNVNDITSKIFKKVIDDQLACNYNYLGTWSQKKAFLQLSLDKVVIDAVKAKQFLEKKINFTSLFMDTL
ncbi:hypothetical protein RN001_014626 [Aquatica leii]|uniref:DUF4806 domain-containing protein n=1 Tax=Aquatica leii TaxID=1421715 RepID=A0AAN7SBJ3_9COLE|nr:hypothetical protein RN001_014626 [Aquatica leii]